MLAESKPQNSRAIFISVGAITLVWLVVAFGLGWYAHPDNHGFTYEGLAVNEWGDFLAGVFAPVAFFWLFAAVWLQSTELKEQRKELALTRREFEYQREVMKSQAEEAKKQAEYIGAQTRLLESEEVRKKQKEADEAYEQQIRIMMGHIQRHQGCLNAYHVTESNFEFELTTSGKVDPFEGFGHDLEVELAAFMSQMSEYQLEGYQSENPSGFGIVLSDLAWIVGIRDDLSMSKKVHFDNCGFAQAMNAMTQLGKWTRIYRYGVSPQSNRSPDQEASPSPDEGN